MAKEQLLKVKKEVLVALEADKELRKRVKQLNETFLDIAALLYLIKEQRLWEQLEEPPLPDFEAYCKQPGIDLDKKTAYRLIGIYKTLILDYKVAPVRLIPIGWGKLADIVPYVNKDNLKDMLADAEALFRRDLQIHLRELKLKEETERIRERIEGKELPPLVMMIHGDCLKELPKLKEKADILLTDPPYGVTEEYWDRFGSKEEYLAFTKLWMGTARKTLKEDYHFFIFCPHYLIADFDRLLKEFGYPVKSRIVWVRKNMAMGRDISDKLINAWEMVFYGGTRPLELNLEWTSERLDVKEYAVPQSNFKDKKLHPTQKPLGLIKELLIISARPDDLVLDPFAGAFTTCVAAKELGIRSIGIELEKDYCDIGKSRLCL